MTGNLGSALIRLRHSSRARAIWVDALCINQGDQEELAAQLLVTAEIYRQAYRTIVWLGMMPQSDFRSFVSDAHSLEFPEAAIASLGHIVKYWGPSQQVRYFVTNLKTRSVEAKEPVPDCNFARNLEDYFRCSPNGYYGGGLRPLEMLFGRSWFSRKWVIKEVAMSPRTEVLFHNCQISWKWMGIAAAIMRTQFDFALRQRRLNNVYNAYLMFRLWERSDLDLHRITFVELLRLTGGFNTSEPKDIFFALLGLATINQQSEHQTLFKADYRLSYEDICISFARSTLESTRSEPWPLAILLDAGIQSDSGWEQSSIPVENRTGMNLPSWVPSWKPGRPNLLSPLSLDDHFNASSGLELYLDNSCPTQLKLQGIFVSTILWTSNGSVASEDDIASSIDWLSTFPFAEHVTPSHLKAYSRTLCAGRDSYGSREPDRAALVLPFIAFAIYGMIPDTKAFHWINSARQTLPEAQQNPWNHGGMSANKQNHNESGIWNIEWMAARERFGHIAGLVARGRRLFLTATGHIGLGPGETTILDSVYIVGGCSMPLVLRSTKDEHNVLVGPCYVDDIMDGEAVSAVKAGDKVFGPLWSDSFRQVAKAVESYSTIDELQIRQIILE